MIDFTSLHQKKYISPVGDETNPGSAGKPPGSLTVARKI